MANVVYKDLGSVTAYASAVEGGYTGTYADFCRDQANFAINATEVSENRKAADLSAVKAAASEKTAVAAAAKAETLINTSGLACLYIDENGILTLEATDDTLVDFRIVDNKDLEVTYG